MRDFYKAVVCLLLWMPCVEGVDEQRQMAEAAAEYAVGNAAGAFARYQALMPQPRPVWQRAILMYNMATARTAQGQFAEALTLLKAIPLDQASSPLLAERVARMRVWTEWQQGLEQMNAHNYAEAMVALRAALTAIPEAERAHCVLQEAKVLPCTPTYETWRRRIEEALEESAKQPPTTRIQTPGAAPSAPQPAQREEEKNKILQTVLQMEQEDAVPLVPQTVHTTEQRPW